MCIMYPTKDMREFWYSPREVRAMHLLDKVRNTMTESQREEMWQSIFELVDETCEESVMAYLVKSSYEVQENLADQIRTNINERAEYLRIGNMEDVEEMSKALKLLYSDLTDDECEEMAQGLFDANKDFRQEIKQREDIVRKICPKFPLDVIQRTALIAENDSTSEILKAVWVCVEREASVITEEELEAAGVADDSDARCWYYRKKLSRLGLTEKSWKEAHKRFLEWMDEIDKDMAARKRDS